MPFKFGAVLASCLLFGPAVHAAPRNRALPLSTDDSSRAGVEVNDVFYGTFHTNQASFNAPTEVHAAPGANFSINIGIDDPCTCPNTVSGGVIGTVGEDGTVSYQAFMGWNTKTPINAMSVLPGNHIDVLVVVDSHGTSGIVNVTNDQTGYVWHEVFENLGQLCMRNVFWSVQNEVDADINLGEVVIGGISADWPPRANDLFPTVFEIERNGSYQTNTTTGYEQVVIKYL